MTELVARHVDMAAVAALARSAVSDPPWNPADEVGAPADRRRRGHPVVALAAGRAFSFSYAEHRELLAAAGADVVDFDPLTEQLPDDTAGLVLPGGFPEQYPAELSANVVVRQHIQQLAADGRPIHAECAGLTFLVDELDGHPMCGVLAGKAHFTERLVLGYRDAVAVVDSALHQVGGRASGHEFHRTAVDFGDDFQPAWAFSVGDRVVRDGAVHGQVHASYLHTHPAGQPESVRRFVEAAAARG